MQTKRLYCVFILLLCIFLSISLSVFAEVIVLKSGKTIQAEIIESGDDYIKIDVYGVAITYNYDEIKSIDGKTVSSSARYLIPGISYEKKPQEIFQEASSAIVYIITQKAIGEATIGSGFVVDHEGVIVTNYHVVQSAKQIEVQFKNGETYPVTGVIYENPKQDVCLLKINARDLPVIPLGDSSAVKIGEALYCIGNPLGLEYSFSDGILSGMRDYEGFKWLQFTAPVSPGNSGGPLLNSKGEAIGIVTFLIEKGQNLNFALAINQIKPHVSTFAKRSFQEFSETAVKADELTKLFMEYIEVYRQLTENARFVCPRYLLQWSLGFYQEGNKKNAITLAQGAKTISEIARNELLNTSTAFDTRYPEEFNDPQIKQKMLRYIEAIIKVANAQLDYFQTGSADADSNYRKYTNEANLFEHEIERLIAEPLQEGFDALKTAAAMCPRWLTSYSESFYHDLPELSAEYIAPCADCEKIMQAVKNIDEIVAQTWIPILDIDERIRAKYAELIEVLLKLDEIYIQFYRTGYLGYSDDAYRYDEIASKIQKEIAEESDKIK